MPRPEYPRPQLERKEWLNLNGTWTYCFDFGKSGRERGFAAGRGFRQEILVPFCPESELSGVGYRDFIEMMWYHRRLNVPPDWSDKRLLLHFGGVDYESEIFIDGRSAGSHWGGAVSFCHDITDFVSPGKEHDLVVCIRDETRSSRQPGGKQSPEYRFQRMRCHYTRTTGIWSTVWLEAVDAGGLRDCSIIPDLDGSRISLIPRYYADKRGRRFQVALYEGANQIAEREAAAVSGIPLEIPVENPQPWEPGNPFLYDLKLTVLDEKGKPLDTVTSYTGMRKVHTEGNRIYLNNEPIYLRLVLDQGFYPDGVWTAPSDSDLKRDIDLSLAAGFNGARLHQKVFEERFHYWADRLGYLTWGEAPSWGMQVSDPVSARNFLSEWREIIIRDRNHPSIIAWTPLNETAEIEEDPGNHRRFHRDLYELTHCLDPTRPVNDASGYIHVKTDLWTVHDYTQNPAIPIKRDRIE